MGVRLAAMVEKYSNLLNPLLGDLDREILELASPKTAKAGSLLFISDEKHLKEALLCPAQAWVVHTKLSELARNHGAKRSVLSTSNVQLAMAWIARDFFPLKPNRRPFADEAIHPSAVIHPSARLGKGVVIGPHCAIGESVEIGDFCVIGSNTTIESGVKVGPHTHIHPQVYIAYLTEIGADCEIHPQTSIGTEGFGYAHDEKGGHHRLTHYGRVILKDRVHIGAGVQIDRGTFEDCIIGSGTIIDNHCHLGHNIRIGENTIITAGMITAGSVTIGNRCVFGGRTTIAGHLQIVDGCQFAGLTGINSGINQPGAYGGYPPQPLTAALKTTATLPMLPKMRKNLSRVLKKLGLEENEGDS